MGSIIAIGNAILTTIMSGSGTVPTNFLITENAFTPANDQIVDENGVDLIAE
jgi:hypothetical protein